MEQVYCKCEHTSSVHTENNDFAFWNVCDDCGKPIEDTYLYFNHYDGEYHCDNENQ